MTKNIQKSNNIVVLQLMQQFYLTQSGSILKMYLLSSHSLETSHQGNAYDAILSFFPATDFDFLYCNNPIQNSIPGLVDGSELNLIEIVRFSWNNLR